MTPHPADQPDHQQCDQKWRGDTEQSNERVTCFAMIAPSNGNEHADGGDVESQRLACRFRHCHGPPEVMATLGMVIEITERATIKDERLGIAVGVKMVILGDQSHHEMVVACIDYLFNTAIHPGDCTFDDW